MPHRFLFAASSFVAVGVFAWAALAEGDAKSSSTDSTDITATTQAGDEEMPPEFTDEYLSDAEVIEIGSGLWEEQCQHCHGANAYPGKAPRLKPSRYDADFVFDRVYHGFRKMPAWKDVYTVEELKAVTAYVMSPGFQP